MEGALNGPLSFMGHEEMFTFSQKTNCAFAHRLWHVL